jgi:hypothetical protein
MGSYWLPGKWETRKVDGSIWFESR